MHQSYLDFLVKRDQQIALLAELCSCSFSIPLEPSFQEFSKMTYQVFDYEQTFQYLD